MNDYKQGAEAHSEVDNWEISCVYYDGYDAAFKQPRYAVPLLGATSLSLLESETPTELLPYDPEQYATAQTFTAVVSQPSKVLDVQLHTSTGPQSATIMFAPDMPAVAVHGDDLLYIKSLHEKTLQGYWELGTRIIPYVEQAFGSEAIEVLSTEACLALGAAVRSSQARLRR